MLSQKDREALQKKLVKRSVPGHRPNKLTEGQREALVRAFLNGETPIALARRFGIARQTVDYHLARAARTPTEPTR